MKNFISIICALIISIGYARAQDIIICRNGDEIESKILKISKSEIEYKKWSNQDGPTYTLEKSEVFMIKYPNGDKDLFKETPAKQDDANKETTAEGNEEETEEYSQPIVATAAADNAELIAQYNTDISEYLDNYYKEKKPYTRYRFGKLNITPSSILSTDDIEIVLTNIETYNGYTGESIGSVVDDNPDSEWNSLNRLKYAIIIKNKTSRIIYIDKAACFGSSSNGKTKVYFDPTEYTVTSGGGSSTGASVNLGSVADALGVGGVVGTLAGGITVGGNKGKATAMTTTQRDNRILTIPPQGSVVLSEDKAIRHPSQKKEYRITGSYEYIRFLYDYGDSLSKKEPHKKYSEENSPETIKYMITYSFDKDLRKCYMTNFGVYISDMFIQKSFNHYKKIQGDNSKIVITGF